jgi:pimeloyl-ACP methyl ester carboxylesterase
MTCYQLKGPSAGPLVVLVSGFAIPSYIWDPTFKALTSRGYQVLRFDPLGRGCSARPRATYKMDLFVEQLNELTTSLGIEKPFQLFGSSMGAAISVSFASKYPQKVDKLILSGPVGLDQPLPLEGKILAFPVVGEAVFYSATRPILKDHVKENLLHPERFPEVFSQLYAQARISGFQRAMLSTLRNTLTRDFSADYQSAGIMGDLSLRHVLVLWGREDKMTPIDLAPRLHTLLPSAELHFIEESGHLPNYEQPKVTESLIIDFLERAR